MSSLFMIIFYLASQNNGFALKLASTLLKQRILIEKHWVNLLSYKITLITAFDMSLEEKRTHIQCDVGNEQRFA